MGIRESITHAAAASFRLPTSAALPLLDVTLTGGIRKRGHVCGGSAVVLFAVPFAASRVSVCRIPLSFGCVGAPLDAPASMDASAVLDVAPRGDVNPRSRWPLSLHSF